jgi:SAM-dependent methyltransferase
MAISTASEYFATRPADIDPVKECEFFSSLKMRNGTFKLTRPSRFAEVEAKLGSVLGPRAHSITQVLDVGASIGSTTVELADYLAELGAAPQVIGTDLFVEAHLVDLAPGIRVLADSEGWPLQYDVARYAVRAWVRRLDFLTLAFIPRLLVRTCLHPLLRARIADGLTIPVRMESRALQSRNIRLVENDIFQQTPSFAGKFDFIRAANILNRGYFSPDRLAVAIANIRSYCRGPGTFFLVLRSGGSGHNGTLFEVGEDGEFLIRSRFGEGSEVESLVLEHRRRGTGIPA